VTIEPDAIGRWGGEAAGTEFAPLAAKVLRVSPP
jgi:hypothetical protein